MNTFVAANDAADAAVVFIVNNALVCASDKNSPLKVE